MYETIAENPLRGRAMSGSRRARGPRPAARTVSGGLTVNDMSVTGGLDISGGLTVTGNLTVTGGINVSGDLIRTGGRTVTPAKTVTPVRTATDGKTACCDDCDWTTEVTPPINAAVLARLHVNSRTHAAMATAVVYAPCTCGTHPVYEVEVSGGG